MVNRRVRNAAQFNHSVMSDSLRPHGPQHANLPCPTPTPGAYSNSISIESVMPSNYLILCCPLLLPWIFTIIKVFSNESVLCFRWPKYWSFSCSIVLPMNIQDWFALGLTDWISLQSKRLSRVFSSTTVQKHQFFGSQLSSQSNSHIHTWLLEKPQLCIDGPLLAK